MRDVLISTIEIVEITRWHIAIRVTLPTTPPKQPKQAARVASKAAAISPMIARRPQKQAVRAARTATVVAASAALPETHRKLRDLLQRVSRFLDS